MEPTYHLEGIIHSKEEMEDFEGPLNLILMLLSKNKIEIRDIQVSLILDQYLAYLAEMEAMDLEIASEFVQMASHLLYIKTRMLLSSEEEEVTELELLMSSLEQLKARDTLNSVKEVLPSFAAAAEQGALYHVKQPEPLPGKQEYQYQHESYELLKALLNVFTRGKGTEDAGDEPAQRKRLVPRRIIYSVRDKSREIIGRFRTSGSFPLSALYRESHSRSEMVAVFLSVLELCSVGQVRLEAVEEDIVVHFAGGSVDKALESIGE